jgi:hypothetical protein
MDSVSVLNFRVRIDAVQASMKRWRWRLRHRIEAMQATMKRWRWRRRHSEALYDCIAAFLSGLFMAVFAKEFVWTTWSEAILVWVVFSVMLYSGLRANSH